MKAAWDWSYPRNTPEDEQGIVDFAGELGFDTLVVQKPTQAMLDAGHASGMKVIAVMTPYTDSEFAETHPECMQKMLPFEDVFADALDEVGSQKAERLAHRWYPFLQGGDPICYDNAHSVDMLKERISNLLGGADGIALDGFGYKNHYACFCPNCLAKYGSSDPELVANQARTTLVESSKVLFEHAKSVAPDSIVINHIWPPFEPDPYYGADLYLDYCSQTISWFYKPLWSLEHVEFEAAEHRRLQRPDRNQFVPFIGFFNEEYHKRSAERVKEELAIAMEYGSGSVVFSTLQGPLEDKTIRRAVQRALGKD